MKFINIIAIGVILILLISPAQAIDWKKPFTKKFWEEKFANGWEKTKDLVPKLLGFKEVEKEDKILGHQIPRIGSVRYLFIGLFAGLYLWGTSLIIELLEKMRHSATGEKYKRRNPLKDISKTKWINMVAGKLWKILVIAILFFVLMQIPLINRLLQILTLEIFIENHTYFWMTVILAIEIGFLPAIFEKLWKWKVERKGNEMLKKTATLYAKASVDSKDN